MKQIIDKQVLKTWLLSSVVAMSATLGGCGAETSSDPVQVDEAKAEMEQNAQSKGTLLLAITDAEEDFVSYTVGLNSILMTRENGDQIEILAEGTDIDFVEYQELSELFSMVKLPVGRYQSISMELDYTDAYILIQDDQGQTYEAQAVDADEMPLTTYQVDFNLASEQALNITEHKTRHLTLDLDLSASNTIKSFEPAVVQVEPFVIASVSLDQEREHRMRGTVASVDIEAQSLTLNIKPMRKRGGQFGNWPVYLEEQTEIEIDGEVWSLASALTHLSNQGDTYPVVAYGLVSQLDESDEMHFTASKILAGTSVPWSDKDIFKGMVTRLEQGLPYVSGLSLTPEAKSRAHVQDLLFSVSDDTAYKGAWNKTMDASYLVPGQRVEALGKISFTDDSSAFDASGENVRILTASIIGQVTDTSVEGQVTLDVERLNQRPRKMVKRPASSFELESVTVDISGLSHLNLNQGDWVNVRGYFNPVEEQADGAQVWAKMVAQYQLTESDVKYAGFYGAQGVIPEIAEDNTSMLLDLSDGRHKLHYRFNPVNMMPDIERLTVKATGDTGYFSLRQAGQTARFFNTYVELLSALDQATETDSVHSVMAKGQLDLQAETLRVTDLVVKLN